MSFVIYKERKKLDGKEPFVTRTPTFAQLDAQVACWGRVRHVEYAVIWITFFTVTRLGLEAGIVIGTLCSMAAFAFEYSKLSVTCFDVAASRSSFMRTYHQRYVLDVSWSAAPWLHLIVLCALGRSLRRIDRLHLLPLQQLSSNMVAVSLSGYVFFGSATSVLEKAILISDLLLRVDSSTAAGDNSSRHEAEGIEVTLAGLWHASSRGP
jgi:MFS superfamily sulfate permease-like transporter